VAGLADSRNVDQLVAELLQHAGVSELVAHQQFRSALRRLGGTLSITELGKLGHFSADQWGRWQAQSDFSPMDQPDTVAASEAEGWKAMWTVFFDRVVKLAPNAREETERSRRLTVMLHTLDKAQAYNQTNVFRKCFAPALSVMARVLYRVGVRGAAQELQAVALYPAGSIGRVAEVNRQNYEAGQVFASLGDYASAVERFRLAADQGHADGQFNLGAAYSESLGVPKDDPEALRWFRLAADQGHAGGQYNLGAMYERGEGVPKDDAEAVRWFRLAAEQGVPEAQDSLGRMYLSGAGVPQDDARALRWIGLAADQGLPQAQTRLGNMYRDGEGVPKDDAEAVRWFRLAAEQRYAGGQCNLGVMYFGGLSVQKDNVVALMWLSLAVAASDENRDTYVKVFDSLAEEMTAEQIAEAQRLAREWKPTLEG